MNKTGDSRMATALCTILAVLWICDEVANADYVYGQPGKVPNVSRPGAGTPNISRDGLELYFECKGENPWSDIWVATRSTTREPWGAPVRLDFPPNSARPIADGLCISPDGLELYFGEGYPWLVQALGDPYTGDPKGYGNGDLWVSKRATKEDPWGKPENLGSLINTSDFEGHPCVSADGLSLYFASERPGGFGGIDLYVATRQTIGNPWGPPVNLGAPINASTSESSAFISADGLSLYCAIGSGMNDIYVSKRTTVGAPWSTLVKFEPVNSKAGEYYLSFSTKDSTLYFFRSGNLYNRTNYDVWQVQVLPIVDFDGDGKVGGREVLTMAEHWGQNYPLCDIGPFGWGDGLVDVNDLMVLGEYMDKAIVDPTLIVHWALDETEGMTLHDSAGTSDGVTLGNPVWHADGKIGGALAFDGKDDSGRSRSVVLNPASGRFSVIAWVKGGGPGRVIVSQASGADWLYPDQNGMLTTDLKASGTSGQSLTSDAYITDGQWHRVALVWDGTNRALHMDGVEVARDTQPNLAASSGVLQIGCARNMAPATLWKGQIDDVRVYNRVVQP